MRRGEQRRASRIKEKDRIAIEVISENEDIRAKKMYYVLSKDISQYGVKIQTDSFFAVGSTLKLKIYLENPQSFIRFHGKVRWVECNYAHESYEMGVEFDDTSLKSKKALEEYLERFDK